MKLSYTFNKKCCYSKCMNLNHCQTLICFAAQKTQKNDKICQNLCLHILASH